MVVLSSVGSERLRRHLEQAHPGSAVGDSLALLGESGAQVILGGVGAGQVSCGMTPQSTLSFSSIGEDSAMLCLNRTICLKRRVLEPQERRVAYDRRLSVEENLLLAGVELIGEAGP